MLTALLGCSFAGLSLVGHACGSRVLEHAPSLLFNEGCLPACRMEEEGAHVRAYSLHPVRCAALRYSALLWTVCASDISCYMHWHCGCSMLFLCAALLRGTHTCFACCAAGGDQHQLESLHDGRRPVPVAGGVVHHPARLQDNRAGTGVFLG